MRFKRILTATVVVSPRNVVCGEAARRRGDHGRSPRWAARRRMRGSGNGRLSASLCQNPRERPKSSILLPVSLPYQPHSDYQSPYALPPRGGKSRPSALWFVLGGVLMVVAGVVFGVAIFHFARTVTHTDAEFAAVGTHPVTLPAHTDRGLFVLDGRPIPRCRVTDTSGTALNFRRPDERFTYNRWVAVRVFDTGDGNILFTCPRSLGGRIRIAEVPSGDDIARLGFVGVLLPLGIGGVGFVVVLVTGILWFSRRPGRPAPMYGAQPGPAYGAAPGSPPASPPGYPPPSPPQGAAPGPTSVAQPPFVAPEGAPEESPS